jgi:hypothetical protein
MTDEQSGTQAPQGIQLAIGSGVTPEGHPVLHIGTGATMFQLDLQDPVQGEQILQLIYTRGVEACRVAAQATRRQNGLIVPQPGGPALPLGTFPGAQPVPPVDPRRLQGPPPGHPG